MMLYGEMRDWQPATGEAEPYGLREQHALVVRGQTILAIIPESEILRASSVCRSRRASGYSRPDRLPHPPVFGGDRAAEWEQRLNGVSYQTISAQGGGINATVTATRNSSPETLLTVAQQRLQRLMNEGVTTVEIKSGYGLNAEAEEKMLLVARQLSLNNLVDISPTLLAAHAVPAEYRQDPDAYLALVCEQIMPTLWQKSYLKRWTCFVKTSALPRRKPSACSGPPPLGIPVKGHVEQLSNLGGAALVSQYKGLSADHIEYLDDAGIQAMAQSGTVAVLLPGAFYFLQERQRPPVAQLREQGVPMAVATDYNPGTSPFASLHLAMNMACVQFGLTPEEARAGVTRHAAQALGRAATHGQLKPGYVADFVVWEANHPVEMVYEPGRNPLYQRVFRGR